MEYLHFAGGVEERVHDLCLSLRRRIEELRERQRAERVQRKVEELRARVRERGVAAGRRQWPQLRDQGTQTEALAPLGGASLTDESTAILEKFWDVR